MLQLDCNHSGGGVGDCEGMRKSPCSKETVKASKPDYDRRWVKAMVEVEVKMHTCR
jgi:hypothetical protein